MKVIGILQPGYLPWLGFFEQLYRSDAFVLYDDVQYDKNGWRNRNRIKTAHGPLWLTVPVLTHGRAGQRINETMVDNKENWSRKHLRGFELNYSATPHFNDYFPEFELILSQKWERLVDLSVSLIERIKGLLEIRTPLFRSSSLNIPGERDERLIKICQRFGARVFYEGEAGKNYIDVEKFRKEGIQVQFQEYRHPVYRQLHGEFISHLSIVDLLFNHGPESLKILAGEMASVR